MESISFLDSRFVFPVMNLSNSWMTHSSVHYRQVLKQIIPIHSLKTPCLNLWQQLTGEARTRILLWYIFLLGFFVAVTVPLMRYFVILQVNARVREDLVEDVEIFQQLLNEDPQTLTRFGLSTKNLADQGVHLPPATQADLSEIFQLYVNRRVPEDDTIFLTFLGDQFYLSNIEILPEFLQPNSETIRYFLARTQATENAQETNDPEFGTMLYYVQPIQVKGVRLGTFVTLHMNAGERQEAFDALATVFQIMLLVLALALILAWLIAGRVLAPLRLLVNTAQTITETDLTQRIAVQGKGELADLAKAFNEMMDRVEVAFETQRAFINDAGHELRTPITIIRGHLEVMGHDPQEQEEALALVMDELDRVSRFVDDLLLLAKAERPDFLQLETIDVRILTEELFSKATALANRHWQIDAVASGRIVGDRQRITEAVMNLAQNATQHTQTSDVIALGSVLTPSGVQIWVRDTGEGVEPEDQQRIFKRFARAAKSRRRSEGAGLGLAIVRAIAEAHGGAILLQSQVDIGSTFTLSLPLEPPKETARHDSNPDC